MYGQNVQTNNIKTLNFFKKFMLAIIVFQLSVYFLQSNRYFSQLIQNAITNAVGFIYNIIDPSIVINGNLLIHQSSPYFLIVDDSCTGLMLIATVCSAIFAFDHSWQVKIKMMVIAILILQGENIIRITHLLYVVKQEYNTFDMFHLYIWQTINFVTALIVIVGLDKVFKGSSYK